MKITTSNPSAIYTINFLLMFLNKQENNTKIVSSKIILYRIFLSSEHLQLLLLPYAQSHLH